MFWQVTEGGILEVPGLFEWRESGYVVGPGSIHPDTKAPYEIKCCVKPIPFPDQLQDAAVRLRAEVPSSKGSGTGAVDESELGRVLGELHRRGNPEDMLTLPDDFVITSLRLARVITSTFVGPRAEEIRVAELAEDFLRDYRINGKKSLDEAETRWKLHLKPVFEHLRAVQVSTDHFNKYVDDRQQAGASNATINRELAALKRMFTLGAQTTPPKVTRIPHFPHLAERNVRKGFVEDAPYAALATACAEVGLWLRGLFECGYTYGWRLSELLGLRVNEVNIASGTIQLNPRETKNDDARTVKMSASVKALLAALISGKQSDDFVFTRDGEVVRDFRDAWEAVTTAAGVPNLLFHDLRRTAVRNMVRAGIPERVAMSVSGHKTRSVFERYNIVSERDLDDAVRKLEIRRETVTRQLQSEADEMSAKPPSSVN